MKLNTLCENLEASSSDVWQSLCDDKGEISFDLFGKYIKETSRSAFRIRPGEKLSRFFFLGKPTLDGQTLSIELNTGEDTIDMRLVYLALKPLVKSGERIKELQIRLPASFSKTEITIIGDGRVDFIDNIFLTGENSGSVSIFNIQQEFQKNFRFNFDGQLGFINLRVESKVSFGDVGVALGPAVVLFNVSFDRENSNSTSEVVYPSATDFAFKPFYEINVPGPIRRAVNFTNIHPDTAIKINPPNFQSFKEIDTTMRYLPDHKKFNIICVGKSFLYLKHLGDRYIPSSLWTILAFIKNFRRIPQGLHKDFVPVAEKIYELLEEYGVQDEEIIEMMKETPEEFSLPDDCVRFL
jgi:hypothetical protein